MSHWAANWNFVKQTLYDEIFSPTLKLYILWWSTVVDWINFNYFTFYSFQGCKTVGLITISSKATLFPGDTLKEGFLKHCFCMSFLELTQELGRWIYHMQLNRSKLGVILKTQERGVMFPGDSRWVSDEVAQFQRATETSNSFKGMKFVIKSTLHLY